MYRQPILTQNIKTCFVGSDKTTKYFKMDVTRPGSNRTPPKCESHAFNTRRLAVLLLVC